MTATANTPRAYRAIRDGRVAGRRIAKGEEIVLTPDQARYETDLEPVPARRAKPAAKDAPPPAKSRADRSDKTTGGAAAADTKDKTEGETAKS